MVVLKKNRILKPPPNRIERSQTIEEKKRIDIEKLLFFANTFLLKYISLVSKKKNFKKLSISLRVRKKF